VRTLAGNSVGLWVLAALTLIGCFVTQLQQHTVPSWASGLLAILVGAVAGIAQPVAVAPAAAAVAAGGLAAGQ
jgi:hypothetical protein